MTTTTRSTKGRMDESKRFGLGLRRAKKKTSPPWRCVVGRSVLSQELPAVQSSNLSRAVPSLTLRVLILTPTLLSGAEQSDGDAHVSLLLALIYPSRVGRLLFLLSALKLSCRKCCCCCCCYPRIHTAELNSPFANNSLLIWALV